MRAGHCSMKTYVLLHIVPYFRFQADVRHFWLPALAVMKKLSETRSAHHPLVCSSHHGMQVMMAATPEQANSLPRPQKVMNAPGFQPPALNSTEHPYSPVHSIIFHACYAISVIPSPDWVSFPHRLSPHNLIYGEFPFTFAL